MDAPTIPDNIDQLNANIATETLGPAGKSNHTLDNNAANDDSIENSS